MRLPSDSLRSTGVDSEGALAESEKIMQETRIVIFDAVGDSAVYERLVATGRYDEGALYRTVFKDGEIYHRLDTPVRHRRVVVVGDASTHERMLATYDVANGAFDEGARELTIVLPAGSLPRGKSERDGVNDLLASVPATRLGNKLVLVGDDNVGTPEYAGTVIKAKRRRTAPDTAFDLFGSTAPILLLSTASYGYLADGMSGHGNFEVGAVNRTERDGKPFFSKLESDVRGREVVLVTGTINDDETMELYHTARAIVDAGALSLTIVLAYYGYGTMERKVKPGEVVKGKIRARMLSSIPASRLGNRVIFVDLHSEGIPYYLEGGLQAQHVYAAKHLVASVAREILTGEHDSAPMGSLPLHIGADDPGVSSTDAGRGKWVESMCSDIGLNAAFALKKRVGKDQTKSLGVLGTVTPTMIVYDDKYGTGGTAEEACQGVRAGQYGKKLMKTLAKRAVGVLPQAEIVMVTTHSAGVKGAVERLRTARDKGGALLVQRLVYTDSNPLAVAEADGEFAHVKSIAYLLAQAVQAGM